MKYLLRNLTRRPVSIPCNSGSYRHLPPKHQLLFEAVEIERNAMVEKLVARGVLAKMDEAEANDADAAAAEGKPRVKPERGLKAGGGKRRTGGAA